ncbi:metal-dependent hydrolase [Solihabitans fulvus]|uniref:Metal-dependent hydrolase n=2 Tax=Solihabitans fulvus TaxID=1892852 RepID=A0A5B2W9M6_9PSEU|nr:metal-dependent hydrolase [Solihabitans fulvus]
MGRTHALTGVLAGLLVGRLIGLDTLPELGPFTATVAGYALVPDLDHPSSAATRMLGPVTGLLSRALRAASAWLYQHTKGPKDEPGGTHRHLTHTFVFATVLGGICAVSTACWGPWAVVGWLAFGLLLAVDRLGTLTLVAFGVGAAAWLPATLNSPQPAGDALLCALDQSTGWLGLAVAAGCAAHCLGDALTESGCPFLWPFLRLRGETWYEIRPPRWLRFHTGKRIEQWLVFPAVALGCAAAVPGLMPQAVSLFTEIAQAGGGGLR